MTTTVNGLLSAVLAGTVKALDPPTELYAQADAQYHAIGEYLAGRDDAIGEVAAPRPCCSDPRGMSPGRQTSRTQSCLE